MKIIVLGSGSWGTAVANVLADNGNEVFIWSRDEKTVVEINEKKINKKYLPNATLNESLKAIKESELEEEIKDTRMVVFAVPSQQMRSVAKKMKPYIKKEQIVLHISKGLELSTKKRMSEVIIEELGEETRNKIAVLSGPSHAEDVIERKPTTVAISTYNKELVKEIGQAFNNEYFRTYKNDDVVGVELCGTFKNIIAIAAGINDGMKLGDNSKAALVSRGLAEISRLVVALGGSINTVSGLTGIGDLMVTCNSVHSRNWKTGYLLAQNKKIEEIMEELGMVAEGVKAIEVAKYYFEKFQIDMPITNELYEVIKNDKKVKDSLKDLMLRQYRKE